MLSKVCVVLFLTVELSRVHIPMKAGVEGSDYINASFLQVPHLCSLPSGFSCM